jgi:hypothetical protein
MSISSLNARKTSREIVKSHLQLTRAHAIASRKYTALVIPVGNTGKMSLRAMSMIEVEQVDGSYAPIKNEDGDAVLLQRWTMLPDHFYFALSSMIQTSQSTVVDDDKTLFISQRGHETECQMIVFAPNGQITYPTSGKPIQIALAKAVRNGNSFRVNRSSNHKLDYDLLLVNRITSKTRLITP